MKQANTPRIDYFFRLFFRRWRFMAKDQFAQMTNMTLIVRLRRSFDPKLSKEFRQVFPTFRKAPDQRQNTEGPFRFRLEPGVARPATFLGRVELALAHDDTRIRPNFADSRDISRFRTDSAPMRFNI